MKMTTETTHRRISPLFICVELSSAIWRNFPLLLASVLFNSRVSFYGKNSLHVNLHTHKRCTFSSAKIIHAYGDFIICFKYLQNSHFDSAHPTDEKIFFEQFVRPQKKTLMFSTNLSVLSFQIGLSQTNVEN